MEKASRQKETLQEELSTLGGKVEKAGADAGFEDCLKQVTSYFPDSDLFGITIDAPIPSTPTSDAIVGESDDSTELDLPPKDDGVVLAQPAANPTITTSNPSIELLDVENPSA